MTANVLPANAVVTFDGRRVVMEYRWPARGRRRAVQPPTPRQLSRDITNGVVEEHLGRRPARHRKDQES